MTATLGARPGRLSRWLSEVLGFALRAAATDASIQASFGFTAICGIALFAAWPRPVSVPGLTPATWSVQLYVWAGILGPAALVYGLRLAGRGAARWRYAPAVLHIGLCALPALPFAAAAHAVAFTGPSPGVAFATVLLTVWSMLGLGAAFGRLLGPLGAEPVLVALVFVGTLAADTALRLSALSFLNPLVALGLTQTGPLPIDRLAFLFLLGAQGLLWLRSQDTLEDSV